MAKVKSGKPDPDLTDQGEEQDDDKGATVEEEQGGSSVAPQETRVQSIRRRIKEKEQELLDLASKATGKRDLYTQLNREYDQLVESLNKERSEVSAAHQDYIDASDAHARVQGELARLNMELQSAK